MQKKLIVLAMASAFAAPAFAATSNVDIYGVMSFSLDYINTHDAVGDSKDAVTGRDNISRIGFKGSEDLGGGLAAIWQIENQLSSSVDGSSIPNGGNTLAQRNTFVGLKGGFGTVLAGRHDTPYKLATGSLDLFADQLADYNAIIGASNGIYAGSAAANAVGFDVRAPGTVAYVSPDFNGLTLVGAYFQWKINEGAAPTKNTDGYSLAGMYNNGPIFASAAYERHNGATCNDGGFNCDNDAWKVGVGGNLGDFKLGLIYEDIKSSVTNSPVARKAWLVNGAYTMGNIMLKAEYAKADNSAAVASTDGAKMWAVGADYNFSKRTKVFAQYADVNNDTTGKYSFYSYPTQTGPLAGKDVTGFSAGITHSF